ncbi:MAG: putative baseplate assembly protein [Methanothrix sp.]|nr:putative baseplate assembly protein [Methanothrix sp.]
MAATAQLAFTADKGKEVVIPEGLRIQSVPGQNEKPQKFETSVPIKAFGSLNEIRLHTVEPFILGAGSVEAIVKGINNGIAVGNYILVVGKERSNDPANENWDVRRITDVQVDSQNKTTTIKWKKGLGDKYAKPPSLPELFVFRLQTWPFGFNAPDWNFMPTDLRPQTDWKDDKLSEDKNIFLDSVYNTISPESWIALITTNPKKTDYQKYVEIYKVKDVIETTHSGYMLNSKVSRLTVEGENLSYFPVQETFIMAQSEPLVLAESRIKNLNAGKRLVLDGYYPDLEAGRNLILTGETADGSNDPGIEVAQVDRVDNDSEKMQTSLDLKDDLKKTYKIETVRIYGNIGRATHGEKIKNEIMGDGDSSNIFQSFSPNKPRVTFVPDSGKLHGSASTLKLRVDGVEWHEKRNFYGCEPKERIYTTSMDAEGKMTVHFGDGINGARLPTGRNNIVASYRQGLGREGNVKPRTLTTLLDRPVGLKSVTNPADAAGGDDPESLKDARRNAPNTVRTFERIVSLRDFEDAAREYPGVAKARASRKWDGEKQLVNLIVAGDNKKIDPATKKSLMEYLNARRDLNRALRVEDYDEVKIKVVTEIMAKVDYDEEKVRMKAIESLKDYFSFQNQDLGRPVHLSDIYSLLQKVEGAQAVRIIELMFRDYLTDLKRRGVKFHKEGDKENADLVQDHLFVYPKEIAVIDLEPDDVGIWKERP